MNIVEFAEEICDFKLSDFQKEYLKKCYESISNNKRLYYIPPRGNSRLSLDILQSIAIMRYVAEHGLLKENKND